ncbi:MAG: hypothetical protein FWC43_00190 [Planctomycetaceae bacterium]|nr:hypothetical protein [Planctomycetaceae bacterium]
MSKILCIASLALSCFLLLIFLLDLAIGIPFAKADMRMDLGFVAATGIIAVFSFLTMRETR